MPDITRREFMRRSMQVTAAALLAGAGITVATKAVPGFSLRGLWLYPWQIQYFEERGWSIEGVRHIRVAPTNQAGLLEGLEIHGAAYEEVHIHTTADLFFDVTKKGLTHA